VELGLKFRSDVNGTVTGVRFYKGSGDTTTHTGSLWSSNGALLATGTFTGETSSGWQQLNFSTPVAIAANTTYIASYHTGGPFYQTLDYFQNTSFDRPPLHALKDSVAGGNGVYGYGPIGTFPISSYRSSNYWVDVVFVTSESWVPSFNQLISSDAQLEELADGFALPEGPAWSKAGGYLLFSDVLSNSVYKWQAGSGVSLFLKPSGYTGSTPFEGPLPGSNGLAFDPAGRLVLAQHGDRRITRLEPDGRRTVLADRYDGKRLNSPNDLVFDAQGNLYFTDPPYGLPGGFNDENKELNFSGVYRLSPDGTLTLLTQEIGGPNGIGLSPSGKTLYVADSENADWLAYDVQNNGTLTNKRVFYNAENPDGLKVDRLGNIFAAGQEGLRVFAPNLSLLGTIPLGMSNVGFGNDGSVLYITSDNGLFRIQTLTKGLGFQ
jgi:gluconolactonase